MFDIFFLIFLFRIYSGRFVSSGSMIPRLVPEISPLDTFCDVVAGVGIGDSRSWIPSRKVAPGWSLQPGRVKINGGVKEDPASTDWGEGAEGG